MDANLRRQPPVAAPYCTAPPRQPERGVYEGGLRFTALEFIPAKRWQLTEQGKKP